MTPDEAVGLAIRHIRQKQGLAQEEVGASQSFVSDVERGKKSMTIQSLSRFAIRLGVLPATLVIRATLLANPDLSFDELVEGIRKELEP